MQHEQEASTRTVARATPSAVHSSPIEHTADQQHAPQQQRQQPVEQMQHRLPVPDASPQHPVAMLHQTHADADEMHVDPNMIEAVHAGSDTRLVTAVASTTTRARTINVLEPIFSHIMTFFDWCRTRLQTQAPASTPSALAGIQAEDERHTHEQLVPPPWQPPMEASQDHQPLPAHNFLPFTGGSLRSEDGPIIRRDELWPDSEPDSVDSGERR
eukprot:11977035-Alexandrium_andersonii.AAC.1